MEKSLQLYFHGLPGCKAELDFALPDWQEKGLIAPERLSFAPKHTQALQQLRSQIAKQGKIHLIGFSLGSMSALKLAASLPKTTVKLDLIAPAAPLELGDFLDQIAGKQIFDAALKGQLGAITLGQSLLARLSSAALIKVMFASAPAADKALLSDRAAQTMLRAGLKHSLITHQDAYKDELRAFVQPWSDTLNRVTCPVTIWQGTEDTWVPMGLSEALAKTLPGGAEIKYMKGLGHYSALAEALPQIVSSSAPST